MVPRRQNSKDSLRFLNYGPEQTEQQRFPTILNYGPEQTEQQRFPAISDLWSRADRTAKIPYDSEL
jgi:hypothetical protein